jgi:hypothetical protein
VGLARFRREASLSSAHAPFKNNPHLITNIRAKLKLIRFAGDIKYGSLCSASVDRGAVDPARAARVAAIGTARSYREGRRSPL